MRSTRERDRSRFLWAAALAVLLVALVRGLLLGTYYVPSESMLPTLLVGDHILVSRLAYGARLPFLQTTLGGRGEPARGDVVVFDLARRGPGDFCPVDRCPELPVEGFVKRIVGLPGDSVEMRGGRLLVNGEGVAVERTGERVEDAEGRWLPVGRASLPGAPHPILDDPDVAGLDQVRIVVPADRYFVLGDNRDHSSDSRFWGTVHRDQLVGRVTRIYWSWNNREPWSALLDPRTWWRLLAGETRWERLGMRVR